MLPLKAFKPGKVMSVNEIDHTNSRKIYFNLLLMNSSSRIRSAYTTQNKAQLIQGGLEYFTLLEKLIEEAVYTIQLQVYIFDEDETGNRIAEKLIIASQRGIRVQILLDGYASSNLSSHLRKRMRNNGILLRFFEPIFKSRKFYFGRRLHHKVLVVDGERSLVGGINISNRYNDTLEGTAWLDWAVYVEGRASQDLFKLCNQLYAKTESDILNLPQKQSEQYSTPDEPCAIRIRRNDWVMNMHQISASYMDMLKHASKEIIIMSSYFIPGRFFRRHIEAAAKKGICIKIILGGMSDVGISRNAEKYFYRWAMRNGIEIFEYQTNVLHGKIAVSDAAFTTIGSYNINDISALASIELNLDISNRSFSLHVHEKLSKLIKDECKKVDHIRFLTSTNWFQKFIQWCSYEFYRMTFTLFTFYFKRKRNY